jgi:hypothetical protein
VSADDIEELSAADDGAEEAADDATDDVTDDATEEDSAEEDSDDADDSSALAIGAKRRTDRQHAERRRWKNGRMRMREREVSSIPGAQ